ncbi:MAG TPA: Usg family protein [Stellaceae bacterium]|nr:Usg family protein [Stellaceae bacterium]
MEQRDATVTPYELQLRGYRLTTAEIIYRLPDHPALLQSFIWQKFDLAPEFPELQKFLDFWRKNIEGRLHSVNVKQSNRTAPNRFRHFKHQLTLH